MDDIIERGVEISKKRSGSDKNNEKRRKKRRVEVAAEIDPEIEAKRTENIEIARKELKLLLLKYPEIDISRVIDMKNKIKSLDDDEVEDYVENVKIGIGLESPSHAAEDVVGLIGLALRQFLKDDSIYENLMADENLIASFDQYIPTVDDYFSGPLKIAHRLSSHISNAIFAKK